MSYLLDTSFWFALLNRSEQTHAAVLAVAQQITEPVLTATPVTAEVAYLVRRELGQAALGQFVFSLAEPDFQLVEPMPVDYQRASAVVHQYQDAHIDFVDAVLVAVAERLRIRRILTLDQRHFRLFRPHHCSAFELFP